MEIPVFPLKGKNIIEAGISDNRQIGNILDELEEEWILSNFSLSFDDLMLKAKDIVRGVA